MWLSSCSCRGRPCCGERCSLVERRLFGRLVLEPSLVLLSPVVPLGGSGCRRGTSSGRGRFGQTHCWVLRDQVVWTWNLSGHRACELLIGRIRPRSKRRPFRWCRTYLENYTVDASIFVARQATKGTWWMPWHQEPMKDVGACDKPREVGNRAVIRGFPNGETQLESCPVTSA